MGQINLILKTHCTYTYTFVVPLATTCTVNSLMFERITYVYYMMRTSTAPESMCSVCIFQYTYYKPQKTLTPLYDILHMSDSAGNKSCDAFNDACVHYIAFRKQPSSTPTYLILSCNILKIASLYFLNQQWVTKLFLSAQFFVLKPNFNTKDKIT